MATTKNALEIRLDQNGVARVADLFAASHRRRQPSGGTTSGRELPTLVPDESDATLLDQPLTGKVSAALQPPTITGPIAGAAGLQGVVESPVPSEARNFLNALFTSKPGEHHLLIWTLPEKRSYWFQNVESAIQFAESHREKDLYVGVGLSGKDYGSSRRCPSNEVAGIVGVWADLDLKSDAHPNPALPTTIQDAMKILPEQFPPTFVIRTGNGVQAWWLFHRPLIFHSDEDRRDARDLALRWQSLLRRNAAALGWSFDRLADLARVLRIPGTQNCKDPSNPRLVVIQSQCGRRYEPSGLADYLDSVAVSETEARTATDQDLNRCHRFPGFVYQQARFSSDHKSIEIAVRPRKGSLAVCSRCHQPAPGYDQLSERRFEFIPFWGFLFFLLYSVRRVHCHRCDVAVVEEVPWGDGKRTLTRAYMLFLARWARRLSWKETAEAFRTSWEKVFDAVEHVVTFGLEHRKLGAIDAIGVDEIQYAKGHKCLTLVYQIDLDVTRLLWVGKERTIESFQRSFTTIGDEVASKIVFVCSDMWEPYLKVIRQRGAPMPSISSTGSTSWRR
jgi:transposase